MTDQEFWDICFIQVIGIRLHPRNDENGTTRDQVEFAASVADLAIKERRQCQRLSEQ